MKATVFGSLSVFHLEPIKKGENVTDCTPSHSSSVLFVKTHTILLGGPIHSESSLPHFDILACDILKKSKVLTNDRVTHAVSSDNLLVSYSYC